eukprot:746068-Hanusia_phi.AAC.1
MAKRERQSVENGESNDDVDGSQQIMQENSDGQAQKQAAHAEGGSLQQSKRVRMKTNFFAMHRSTSQSSPAAKSPQAKKKNTPQRKSSSKKVSQGDRSTPSKAASKSSAGSKTRLECTSPARPVALPAASDSDVSGEIVDESREASEE